MTTNNNCFAFSYESVKLVYLKMDEINIMNNVVIPLFIWQITMFITQKYLGPQVSTDVTLYV